MIVLFVGAKGDGKTRAVNLMAKYHKDSIIIDFKDENESNQEANAQYGLRKARTLSNEGNLVFVAAQAWSKKTRDEFLDYDKDIVAIMENYKENEKQDQGENENFNADYEDIKLHVNIDRLKPSSFTEYFMEKRLHQKPEEIKATKILKD